MFSKDELNWTAAENACSTLGSHLAEINDETENAFLKSNALQLGQIFWLGGSDHLEEGDWRWVHSQTRISDSTFSDWGPNYPDNNGGNEHYLVLVYDLYWGDISISKSYPYICEMRKWD